jgi:DNA-binding response OmpR family regulator
MKVLLIEPDKLLATSISIIFEQAGHQLDWQANPQEAINYLDEQLADVIITDLSLCAHSAIEVLFEMRSYSEWQGIPVIIFSSLPAREIYSCVASLEQLGVKAYHHKASTSLAELLASTESYQPVAAK